MRWYGQHAPAKIILEHEFGPGCVVILVARAEKGIYHKLQEWAGGGQLEEVCAHVQKLV